MRSSQSLGLERVRRFIRLPRLTQWQVVALASLASAIVAGVLIYSIVNNGALGLNLEETRNIALIIAGAAAASITVWRTLIAGQETKLSGERRLAERLEHAFKMLGDESSVERRLGIYLLERLAREEPKHYYIPILRALCDYVREPPRKHLGEEQHVGPEGSLRSDVQGAVQAIGRIWDDKKARQIGRKIEPRYRPNLVGAKLDRARLWSVNLSQVSLQSASLRDAHLGNVNFTDALIDELDLTGADLTGTSNYDPDSKSPVFGLTQDQLDSAFADPTCPPKLDGVKDTVTDRPLSWNRQAASAENIAKLINKIYSIVRLCNTR